jgi:aminoglycoside N3'-acetyltransferase
VGLTRHLPAEAKLALRGWNARARRALVETLFPFDRSDLIDRLRGLGIGAGDMVLAHTAFARFEGFRGGAGQALEALLECVGNHGVLMMPTMPFTGSALQYAESGAVTDIRRTPSRMGLLTELLRRRKGAVRSIHPTHPVAIWGEGAEEIAAGHHAAQTPCGKGSPFERLHLAGGKILFAGVGVESMTFFHYVEERLEPRMPFSPFTQEWFDLRTQGPDGRIYETRTRLFEPSVSARRNIPRVAGRLSEKRQVGQSRVRRLELMVVGATDVAAAMTELAAQGEFCYLPAR